MHVYVKRFGRAISFISELDASGSPIREHPFARLLGSLQGRPVQPVSKATQNTSAQRQSPLSRSYAKVLAATLVSCDV